jgi:ABC-2 type transport system ATP-binding protein
MVSESEPLPQPVLSQQQPMIELRRLHRSFGSTQAVRDVSFQVPKGAIFGYIGPNGAGKTTSMRILATLDVPTLGDALVDGFSVVNDPDRVRERLGFMPDYFGPYANMNCREYLDFFARAYKLAGKKRLKALRSVMDFTRLGGLAEKPVRGLSKGMKQRLCLARTLIHDPSVLILDEPAAGLDPRARIELREMIRRLAEIDKTVLISSHILTELAEICDRVAIIELGGLLAQGSVSEILAKVRGSQQVHVRVRVLGGGKALADWLNETGAYESVRADGELVTFSHAGDREAEADLLKQMIDRGYRIAEYHNRELSLEDAFLSVTEGAVQ